MIRKGLSAPQILIVAVAFALLGLGLYGVLITHPHAAQLMKWARAPISSVIR